MLSRRGILAGFAAALATRPTLAFIPEPVVATVGDGRLLLCNGQAVSRLVYADLFSIIGTSYGAGDGRLTFNLPEFCQFKPWEHPARTFPIVYGITPHQSSGLVAGAVWPVALNS